jgi:YVTN family beta-propeller protein
MGRLLRPGLSHGRLVAYGVILRRLFAAALAAVLLGAARAPLTVYQSPAGTRPAGAPNVRQPFNAILPNGRTTSPVGENVFVGIAAGGVALSPDGKFAIISNDDEHGVGATLPADPRVGDGYSLVVVDAQTMRVASGFLSAHETLSGGIVAVRDPNEPGQTLVFAAGGSDNGVHVFDLNSDGTLIEEPHPIVMPLPRDPRFADDGHAYPLALAVSPDGRVVYVTNALSGTVSAIDIARRALLDTANVGLFPAGIVVAGERVYVTNEGVARIGVLQQPALAPQFAVSLGDPQRTSTLYSLATGADGDLDSDPSSAGYTAMDPIPDGVQSVGAAHPSAIVTSADGRYAFVALANVDRVAVVELGASPRVVGGISLQLFNGAPYGTQPCAIARSADGKRLYVALAGIDAVAVLDSSNPLKIHRLGLIPTGWYPDALELSSDGRYLYALNARGAGSWSTLQRVDLKTLKLQPVTLSALRYARTATYAKKNAIVPPLRSLHKSSAIAHVVFVLVNGESTASPEANVLRSLSTTFASSANAYTDDADAWLNQQVAAGGTTTPYDRMIALGDSPEVYPRAGYIFNALQRASISYRDYGGLLQLAGYRNGRYPLDVPALAALSERADPAYPAPGAGATDAARAAEFVRDFDTYAQAGQTPPFTFVWLSSSDAADADRALGTIVQFLTHAPQWSSMAIFVVADGNAAATGREDALLISPYARRGYASRNHLSTAGVLKTEEELLGLTPLSIDDLLASDMADFFARSRNSAPWSVSQP